MGGLIGAGLCLDDGGEYACLASVVIGAYIGGVLAVPLGVYAVGASGDQDGSLGSAILGSVLGSARHCVGFVFERHGSWMPGPWPGGQSQQQAGV